MKTPVKFANVLKAPFFAEHLRWLLQFPIGFQTHFSLIENIPLSYQPVLFFQTRLYLNQQCPIKDCYMIIIQQYKRKYIYRIGFTISAVHVFWKNFTSFERNIYNY